MLVFPRFPQRWFNEPHPDISRTFNKELSDSLELGFKTTIMNGLGTLNVAVFSIDQEDAQVTRFNGNTFTSGKYLG